MARPFIEVLGREERKIIHEAALKVLNEVGVKVPDANVRKELKDRGALIEGDIVKMPPDLVRWALNKAPKRIEIFNRDGKLVAVLSEDNIYFNPGSAATKILDYGEGKIRDATLIDLLKFAIITDSLRNIAFQSTALVPSDAPIMIRDRIRLYPILLVSSKPIVTGAFTEDGIPAMVRILDAVCDIEKKPIAIFDVCPSPPLKWSKITLKNLVDCAKIGVPAEIIPMPQIGATAPVTIAGALVQHHAEALSGITIAQVIREGAPVIYGGSPCLLDMRYGTPLIASPESILVSLAYVELAKEFGLPTHTYMCLADSKRIDYQAGVESMMGAILAAMRRINVISGPGMLGFENVQSMEKLVLDEEVCGYALRILRGFNIGAEELAIEVIREVGIGGHFLGHRHTLRNYRRQLYMPSLFDRTPLSRTSAKRGELLRRAHEYCEKVIRERRCSMLDNERLRELEKTLVEVCGSDVKHFIKEVHKELRIS
ncbi:MAG: hypothetical protein DRJ66_06390 [Thermoprotei archaeon]|nr:MAG: hypothetical protein DRJ66_06390 [Thermoprotei archaeon]